jgi:hypothetical protein
MEFRGQTWSFVSFVESTKLSATSAAFLLRYPWCMPRDQSVAPTMRKPTVAFDTSTLNRLVKDDNPEPSIAEILARFDVRLTDMSIGEIYATKKPVLREKLNAVCRRFLNAGGQCLLPAHWIIGFLMLQFHKDPLAFDWRGVQVRSREVERLIDEGTIIGDEGLVSEQRSTHYEAQDQFEEMFGERRAIFDALVANGKAIRPKTFQAWLAPSRHDGGLYWRFARGLYAEGFGRLSALENDSVLTDPPDDDMLKRFDDCCPPFRAFVTAISLSFYDRCIRHESNPEFSAGRNDQMMSIYLPYADQFITAEEKGMQEKCLREVAASAKIPVLVRAYDDLCQSFLLDQPNRGGKEMP